MTLMFPCNYIRISQLFKKGTHNGLDLVNYENGSSSYSQDILAAYDGEVIAIKNNYKTVDSSGRSYGNYVKIKHNDEISTLVAHLKYNSVMVKVGDKVKQGQKLGIMGTTGHSYGIHVHYEVFKNNVKVDPLLYTKVHANQEVNKNSLKYVTYNHQINPVERNDKIDQLKVNASMLNIRENAGTEYKSIGFVEKNKIYNYYDVIKKDDYTWYKIGVDKGWIANDGKYLTIYESDKQYSESDNKTDYKFKYTVEKTGYYKIKLNKDEVLYIK